MGARGAVQKKVRSSIVLRKEKQGLSIVNDIDTAIKELKYLRKLSLLNKKSSTKMFASQLNCIPIQPLQDLISKCQSINKSLGSSLENKVPNSIDQKIKAMNKIKVGVPPIKMPNRHETLHQVIRPELEKRNYERKRSIFVPNTTSSAFNFIANNNDRIHKSGRK